MTNNTDLISTRIASLPMAESARREALAYVASGETLAQVFLSIAKWLDLTPALKPVYRDHAIPQ